MYTPDPADFEGLVRAFFTNKVNVRIEKAGFLIPGFKLIVEKAKIEPDHVSGCDTVESIFCRE